MDKPLAIHDKKTTKPKHRQNPQKPKKKQQEAPNAPVKVVYIGNPVNFNTSASEFRSLVQQLTGKDSYASDNSCVGGLEQHQDSVLDSGHASMEVKDPENIGVADQEAEEIASSSSLNGPTPTSDHNSNNLLILGHGAVHDDNDVYNMPDQMFDSYLPPDFDWYDQY